MEIHPQLVADTHYLGKLSLCHVLLMNDSQFPWLVLVPGQEEISEVYQLDSRDQQTLASESAYIAKQMSIEFQADKMNVAAIGNIVSQLHIHHIVRYQNDAVWPKPVWGQVPAKPYTDITLKNIRHRILGAMPLIVAGHL